MFNIKAVLLDADGVVQMPKGDWLSSVAALSGIPDQREIFLNSVFEAEKPCLIGSRNFRDVLSRVLHTWNSQESVDSALRVWTQIDTSSEVLNLVQALRARDIVVALATNQQSFRAEFMTKRLNYLDQFDHLFYSCDIGCLKPDERFFQAVFERLKVAPGDTLFIDDHGGNVDTAKYCGLNAEKYHVSEGRERLETLVRHYGLLNA